MPDLCSIGLGTNYTIINITVVFFIIIFQTLYADLEVATSKPSSSSKKTPQPSAVQYSSVKHEVEYTALSHSQPAAHGKIPAPTPAVNYSAVSHR